MKRLFRLFIFVFTVCLVYEIRPALAVDPCLTIDPNTRARERSLILNDEGEAVAVLRGVSDINTVWNQGQTVAQETGSTLILTVRFLDGSPDEGTPEMEELVRQIAPEWSKHANIRFEFVEHGLSDIRVGFDPDDGNWSYVGSEAGNIAKTMNLAIRGASEDGKRSVILHEFGHALSLMHEHQNPAASIQWDEKAVIDDVTRTWGWPEPKIRRNILTQLKVDHTNFTEFDSDSIMLYPIPSRWTIDDFETDYNTILSTTDKHFIGTVYGAPDPNTVINIPDANLRAKIEATLGKASGAPITIAEMASLTQLDASNAGIRVLTGLECAINLTWLNLQDNNISDISPLVSNTGLTAGNRGGFVTVEDTVILWGNPLSHESINTHIPALRERSVSVLYSPPQSITIPDPNLRTAIEQALGKSSGANITKAEMTTMTTFVAPQVNISVLAGLEYATNLTGLYLNDNNISDITQLSGLTQLNWVSLDNNTVSDIAPLSRLTELRQLFLDNNSISNITPLSGLTNLRELHLAANSITDLSPLVANTGLGSGDEVYVRGNPLNAVSINTHIPTLQRRGVEVDFDAPAPAQTVNIPDAHLRTKLEQALGKASGAPITVADMERLNVLTAKSASISNLTGLEHATNLTSLWLQDNNISDISVVSGLTNLTELSLHSNNISDISALSGLTNLRDLRLWDNNITDLSPLVSNTGLGSGDEVYVRGNPLNAVSINRHILTLQRRGVEVEFDAPAPAQTVNIPDANLRAAIEKELGKASDATVTVTMDMATLTQLDAQDANISDAGRT